MNAASVDVRARLAEWALLLDETLESFLPSVAGEFARLAEAMRYSLFAGGKRLRPALVTECCKVAGGRLRDALPAACAVEMIHTYSLIHDDLPAMDDDDLRRGKPSCHRAFDEATAILAGDALLSLAFETAARTEPAAVAREVVRTLARAAGPECLVGGQMLDVANEAGRDCYKRLGRTPDLADSCRESAESVREAAHNKAPDSTSGAQMREGVQQGAKGALEAVEAIHDHKTADLFAASCRSGALVGTGGRGKIDGKVESLERYGRALGRAFQIADDILDATSTPEELGKTPGKDAAAGKATYPAAVGLEKARARARELVEEAIGELEEFGGRAEWLRALARFVVERKR